MLRRGWRYVLATLRRVKPLYIWSFNAGAWGLLLTSWGYHYLDRKIDEQHASYHYQPARDETQPTGALLGQPKPRKYDPDCQAPVNREDSDLCAQWSAVEAVNEGNGLNRINLWLSILTVLITATGTSLLIWTLWETRQTARRELRAYISVTKVTADIVTDETFHGSVEIINRGATPATIFQIAYMVWAGPLQDVDSPSTIGPEAIPQAFAAKVMGKDHPETIRVSILHKDRKKYLGKIRAGKATLYIYGWVIYRDIFNVGHGTSFAYTSPAYKVETGDVFMPCIGGNGAI